ncbi:unnamed protein product [Phytophthora fragariaefolia]|uniref:Unnamed protein product n=1 Tax=Phytophthora fragariaefolia TaxID=1490495 RepID=A0A9W7CXP8_9STRA|nr:unnamed protein product [Phytophthora fragariaefolia]
MSTEQDPIQLYSSSDKEEESEHTMTAPSHGCLPSAAAQVLGDYQDNSEAEGKVSYTATSTQQRQQGATTTRCSTCELLQPQQLQINSMVDLAIAHNSTADCKHLGLSDVRAAPARRSRTRHMFLLDFRLLSHGFSLVNAFSISHSLKLINFRPIIAQHII